MTIKQLIRLERLHAYLLDHAQHERLLCQCDKHKRRRVHDFKIFSVFTN